MSLRNRLQRLENHTGPVSRCPTCASWSALRVVSNDWRTNLPVEPETPARCPSCGYEPTTLVIEDVLNWRDERSVRAE